jgi:hypothetical protein
LRKGREVIRGGIGAIDQGEVIRKRKSRPKKNWVKGKRIEGMEVEQL